MGKTIERDRLRYGFRSRKRLREIDQLHRSRRKNPLRLDREQIPFIPGISKHAWQRAKDRYDIELTSTSGAELIRLCEHEWNTSFHRKKIRNSDNVRIVGRFNGVIIYLVFNPERGIIVTFYPPPDRKNPERLR